MSIIFLVESEQKDDRTDLIIFSRDENGEKKVSRVSNFRPYFYVPESDPSPDYRSITGIEPGHISITGEKVKKIFVKQSSDVTSLRELFSKAYEADILFSHRYIIDEIGEIAPYPLKILYLDIEVDSDDVFPDMDNPTQVVTCITITNSFTNEYITFFYQREDAAKITPSKNIIICNSEEELLTLFLSKIISEDPDVISGWNCNLFDLPYLIMRMQTLHVNYRKLSPLGFVQRDKKTKEAIIKGRILSDMMNNYQHFRKISNQGKAESYSLEFTSQEVLGSGKVELSQNHHSLWTENPDKLVEYNIRDVQLVRQINEKLGIIDFFNQIRCKACSQLDRIYYTSTLIDGLLLRRLKNKLVLPSKGNSDKEDKFEGAFVVEPIPGLYENVFAFDVKGMYPNIIKTFDISYETFNPEGEIKIDTGVGFDKGNGIIPQTIRDLEKERNYWKSQKKKALVDNDKEKIKEYEYKQYALKVIMNAIFGYLGYPKSRLYKKPVANAITTIGKRLTLWTKALLENKGYKVVYGDSVTNDSEIIIRMDGEIKFVKIEELFTSVDASIGEKEYCYLNNVETLTIDKNGNSVFKIVPYVMRHKTDKKIIRTHLTNSWYIDTTIDHSLIGYVNKSVSPHCSLMNRLEEVSPLNLNQRIKSLIALRSIPRARINSKKLPKELYIFMGLFIGDGSFNSKYGKKNYYISLSGGLDTEEIITKVIEPLKKTGWILNYWKKPKGDLMINGLKIVRFLEKFCRAPTEKVIPSFLFEETNENICLFLNGLFSSDGSVMMRNGAPIIKFSNNNRAIIAKCRKLLYLVGISNSEFINRTENKYNGVKTGTYTSEVIITDNLMFKNNIGFIIERKNNRLEKSTTSHMNRREFFLKSVKSTSELKYSDYVYDIEVDETHRFFANGVLVHNTDSVFFVAKSKGLMNLLTEAEIILKEINESYKSFTQKHNTDECTIEIEFDAIFKKILFTFKRDEDVGAKKKYAAIPLWKDNKIAEPIIKYKGFGGVRSDLPKLARVTQKKIIEMIMNGASKDEVVNYLTDLDKKIRSGQVPLDEISCPGAIQNNLYDYGKAVDDEKSGKKRKVGTPPVIQGARYCYDDKTEVLTNGGWKLFKNISKNDKIATLKDGEFLQYQYPIEIINDDYCGKMYKIDSVHVNLCVTPNHNLYRASTWKNKSGKYTWVLRPAIENLHKVSLFKKDCKWLGKTITEYTIPQYTKIYPKNKRNTIRTIHFNDMIVSMNDWLEFLGYVLSEGSIAGSKGGKNTKLVQISQYKNINPQKFEKIEKCLQRLPFNYRYTRRNGNITGFIIKSRQLHDHLRVLGNSSTKFIPRWVFDLSDNQCKILYDAMFLGDGYITNSKTPVYTTISKQLADDIQELLFKMGYEANILLGRCNNKPIYHICKIGSCPAIVNYKHYKDAPAHDKLTNYCGKIYCVNVPNHIIYVRRNGKAVWCGNSNKYLGTKFVKGMKPRWIYVKSVPPGYPITQCITFTSDLPKGFLPDYDVLIEKMLKLKLESLFQSVGWGDFPNINTTNSKLSAWGIK